MFLVIAQSASIDSSISDSIKQSSKLAITKVIENSNGTTELAVTADMEQGEKIVLTYGGKMVILLLRFVAFLYRKPTCLRTPILYKSGLLEL